MFWAQAVILLAVAVFLIVVLTRHHPLEPTAPPGSLDPDQLKGFGYVGAGVLALLAAGVVVLGLLDRPGYGQAVGMLGLFAFFAYLVAAALILGRRRP